MEVYWYRSGLTYTPGENNATNTTSDGRQAFLCIGDSIAAGFGAVENTLPTSGTAYEFDRTTNVILEYGAGAQVTNFSRNRFAPTAKFCIDYNAATGYKPVIINRGAGSSFVTPFDSNNWQTSGTNYNDAVTAANLCLSQLGITKLRAIIIPDILVNDYHTDPTYSVADVNTYFRLLLDNLIADFDGVDIFIGSPGRSVTLANGARPAGLRNILIEACKDYSNVYIGCSLGAFIMGSYYLADAIHPNDSGRDQLGAMLARSVNNYSYTKWARSIISCSFYELSTDQKTAIQTFVNDFETEYFNTEAMYCFKGYSNGLKAQSAYDWSFRCCPEFNGNFTTSASSHIATNGTNQYFNDGHQGEMDQNATVNDAIFICKLKAFTVVNDDYVFGMTTVYLKESSTGMDYSCYSSSGDNYAGEANITPAVWAVKMDNGTVSLHKDGIQVDSFSSATSSLGITGFLGAFSNGGSPSNHATAQFEAWVIAKGSAINQATFITGLNDLLIP